MTTSRPGLWPVHDINATNVTLPENSLYFFSGYPIGLPVPSGDHNGKFMRGGQWAQYMDLNGLRNGDWLDSTSGATAALTTTGLEYNVGDNVLTTGATPTSRAVYLVEGTRVETDAAFLNQVGGTVQGEPLIYVGATVPGRIWIYATDEGASRFESVGPAVADSPAANEMTLVGLQIDALGVITNGAVAPITKPLPTAVTIPVVVPVLISHDDVTTPALSLSNTTGYALTVLAGGADITGNLIVTGGLGVTGNVGVTGDSTFTGTVDVDGAFSVVNNAAADFTGAVTLGSASADAITVNGTTTCNAPLTVANGQAFTANGNSTLGNAGTDTLTVNAEATFNAAKTNIGGNEIEGTAGSIVDVENVECTELRFDSDATPSTTTGVMQFAGRFVTIGLSATAKKFAIYDEAWVASDSTTNAIDDITGASVTITLAAGDVVMVEMSFEAKNTLAANNVNVRIEANTVAIGSTEFYRPVADDVYFAVRRVVEYTAAATAAYTFQARFGASADTTTVQNVHIAVRHKT